MEDGKGMKARIATGFDSVSRQMPGAVYLGLGFWMAWNLVAFSGSVWLVDTESSWRISDLFTIHLLASVATLLVFGLNAKRFNHLVTTARFVFAGAFIAMVGGILIVLARPGLLESQYVFIAGCICTGAGTSCLFIRCAPLFGALNPKQSFMRICQSMLVAGAVYGLMKIMPAALGNATFVALPLLSALLLNLRVRDTPAETCVLQGASRFTNQFFSFLAAIIVFATAAQVLKGALIPLPPSESVISYDYMLLIVVATSIVFIFGTAVLAGPFNLAIVYRPATLVIIALLVIVPLFNIETIVSGALSSAANYAFNLLVWGMLSYVVFQAQADALKVFCLGNAALAAGSVIGSLLTIALINTGMDYSTYMAVCLMLALAAIFISLFVFPEHKMSELLLPIDESLLEDDGAPDRNAPWKEACERVAQRHGLSERESEVFMLLAKGKTTQQVSEIFVISPYTTRAHVRNIYAKLDVHSRTGLANLVNDEMEKG